jgi:hypothetical protein
VRRDPGAANPMQEFAGAVCRIGRKPFGLQAQRLFGTLDHGFARGNFVVGTRRRGLHVDNDCVLNVDQIIKPITELDALVSFRGPSRARVHRRDRLWRLAVSVDTVAKDGAPECAFRG